MRRFYFILLSILMMSCSNDDDGNAVVQSTIQGEWSLVKVTGGFAGVDEDIDKGTIEWDFDEASGMVTITNSISDASFNTILPSGTYTYSISAPADADNLIVNNVNLGRFTLSNSFFTVEESLVDGFTFRFER